MQIHTQRDIARISLGQGVTAPCLYWLAVDLHRQQQHGEAGIVDHTGARPQDHPRPK